MDPHGDHYGSDLHQKRKNDLEFPFSDKIMLLYNTCTNFFTSNVFLFKPGAKECLRSVKGGWFFCPWVKDLIYIYLNFVVAEFWLAGKLLMEPKHCSV